MWRPQLRDSGDEMVLEAAVNGRVDAIVTHNTRDFASAAPRFGVQVLPWQHAQHQQVLTPAQALLMLEKTV